jgi:hypothetical protein
MITGDALRRAFLNPQMEHYFQKKLAPLPPEEVELRIDELLKFLNLAVHKDGPTPVSREIDDVWHYWVLQTVEYASLCSKLPGGLFVNHSSNDYEEFVVLDVKTKAPDPLAMMSFLGAYVKNFGPFEADRVTHWPFATRLMDLLGWSLDELNARLLACMNVAGSDDSSVVSADAEAEQIPRQRDAA